jgi:hypothetical protein
MDREKQKTEESPQTVRRTISFAWDQVKAMRRSTWLYVLLLVLFILDLQWIRSPEYYLPFYPLNFRSVAKTYWSFATLEILGLLALANYLNGNTYEPVKPVDVENATVCKPSVRFLLGRSDALDREIHYLRSGVSILGVLFITVVVFLWNQDDPLDQTELNLITMCAVLVFFCVVAILLSFGVTEVSFQGYEIEGHLLPNEHPEAIYKELLRGVVNLKYEKTNKMRGSVTLGLMSFLVLGIIYVSGPVFILLASFSSLFPLESAIVSLASLLLVGLFLVALALEMGLVGIHVVDSPPGRKSPDSGR